MNEMAKEVSAVPGHFYKDRSVADAQTQLTLCPKVTEYVADKTGVHVHTRPRGRPRTRTPEHFAALLEEHARISEWFITSFGCPAKSDTELITEYLFAHFVDQGLRGSRASSDQMRSKLKTIRNEFSMARTWKRTNPQKWGLLGTPMRPNYEHQEVVGDS